MEKMSEIKGKKQKKIHDEGGKAKEKQKKERWIRTHVKRKKKKKNFLAMMAREEDNFGSRCHR